MKLSENQKRVLRAFARTGFAAQRDLTGIRHWKRSLASLMTHGLVTTHGQCWMLTKEGGAAMPEALDDTGAFDREMDARDNMEQA